ncbi:hypothetical protein ACP70R_021994 [Stipagrostis hirtigluma subsp. patula]
MHNFVPTKSELKRRLVILESHCEECGADDEDIFHVAVRCPVARRFWKAVKELTGHKMPDLHPTSWTSDILEGKLCSANDSALFVCGVWALWTGRNSRRNGQRNWNPAAAARHMASMLEDLMCMNVGNLVPKIRATAQWQWPDTGWVKLNTDASFYSELSAGGAGAVLRVRLANDGKRLGN